MTLSVGVLVIACALWGVDGSKKTEAGLKDAERAAFGFGAGGNVGGSVQGGISIGGGGYGGGGLGLGGGSGLGLGAGGSLGLGGGAYGRGGIYGRGGGYGTGGGIMRYPTPGYGGQYGWGRYGGGSIGGGVIGGGYGGGAIGGGYGGGSYRWPFGQAGMQCYECGTGVFSFIGKLEQLILGLPLAIIRGALRIPAKIVGVAINMCTAVLSVCMTAQEMLMSFVTTIFKIPAKILMGGVNLFINFLNSVLNWGQSCQGQQYCTNALPSYNGFGICAGQWPCVQTTMCSTESCYRASRALQGAGQSNVTDGAF